MYEALLKATQEYQKIAASFAKPGPAALFGLPPAGRALLYAALQKDLGRVLCIVTPGEAEATHFADDLKALGAAVRWTAPASSACAAISWTSMPRICASLPVWNTGTMRLTPWPPLTC